VYSSVALADSPPSRKEPSTEQFFNGAIDDLRVFNRAFTEEEVGLLYQE